MIDEHLRADAPTVTPAADEARSCLSCRAWSPWLTETGDCLFHALQRRAAIAAGAAGIPLSKAARMTSADETCDGWEALRS